MTSAAKPCGSCSQPLTAATPSCQISQPIGLHDAVSRSRWSRRQPCAGTGGAGPSGAPDRRRERPSRRAEQSRSARLQSLTGPGKNARRRDEDDHRPRRDAARLRRARLKREDPLGDPIAQFQSWFEDACRAEVFEPNAMTLATLGADSQPSARIVLLKNVDRRGLLPPASQPQEPRARRQSRAALVFWWGPSPARSARGHGRGARRRGGPTSRAGPGSQIGAWASLQSTVIADRRALEDAARAHEERFAASAVPRPEFWGGFRLPPPRAEFW